MKYTVNPIGLKLRKRLNGNFHGTSGNYSYTFRKIPVLSFLFGIYKLGVVYHP